MNISPDSLRIRRALFLLLVHRVTCPVSITEAASWKTICFMYLFSPLCGCLTRALTRYASVCPCVRDLKWWSKTGKVKKKKEICSQDNCTALYMDPSASKSVCIVFVYQTKSVILTMLIWKTRRVPASTTYIHTDTNTRGEALVRGCRAVLPTQITSSD